MLKEPDIEMVTITAPNKLHAQMTIDIANAGKHVVCEKPLCMTLAEADEMIHTCEKQGVMLGYAEELFFTPKYVKAKEMADQGGFGKIHLVKQSEKHFGPHSAWFWDMEQAGGGALMDLGCPRDCLLLLVSGASGYQERLCAGRHLCPQGQNQGG